jgi:creatinine amidohydrolase
MKAVAERLDREWAASPVRVHSIAEYYRAATTTFGQALKRQGFSDAEIGTHAGLADTSLAMAIDPRLVRPDRFEAAAAGGRADGAYGDPRRANAGSGQIGVEAIVTATVDAIRRATAKR